MACHNGLRTPSGEDVSIGASWRASMMANSSRDPYWQAAVRREVIDHPVARRRRFRTSARRAICRCRAPRRACRARRRGLRASAGRRRTRPRAIGSRTMASPVRSAIKSPTRTSALLRASRAATSSAPGTPGTARRCSGRSASSAGFRRSCDRRRGFSRRRRCTCRQSELCATCHTLVTKARGPKGEIVGELPEQMPFLEWKHSAFAAEQRSCQSCHMPVVEEETPIASVLGAPRKGFARHTFVGGNFFMQRMLNRYRDELGVVAPADQMEAAIDVTRCESTDLDCGAVRASARRSRTAASASTSPCGI